jgi:hypothetical protein
MSRSVCACASLHVRHCNGVTVLYRPGTGEAVTRHAPCACWQVKPIRLDEVQGSDATPRSMLCVGSKQRVTACRRATKAKKMLATTSSDLFAEMRARPSGDVSPGYFHWSVVEVYRPPIAAEGGEMP